MRTGKFTLLKKRFAHGTIVANCEAITLEYFVFTSLFEFVFNFVYLYFDSNFDIMSNFSSRNVVCFSSNSSASFKDNNYVHKRTSEKDFKRYS